MTLSARSASTPHELTETIHGRIGALARAHRLVRPERGRGPKATHTSLEDLLRAVLAPYFDPAAPEDEARIGIVGTEVSIGGEAATSVALVLHELATNAAKYGALSVPGGSIRISWSTTNGRLSLSWSEAGGPPVSGAPSHEGFGSVLARRTVKGQLGGDMDLHWNPEGLRVELSAPMERLQG